MYEVNQRCWNLRQTLGHALIPVPSSLAHDIDQALTYSTFIRTGGRDAQNGVQQFRKGLFGGLVPSSLTERRPFGLYDSMDVILDRAPYASTSFGIKKIGEAQQLI